MIIAFYFEWWRKKKEQSERTNERANTREYTDYDYGNYEIVKNTYESLELLQE